MILMFSHAALAHGHIAGQQAPNLFFHAFGVDAQRIGYFMAHRIHRVVRHMAVEGPITGHCNEFEVAGLADANNLGDLRPPK